MLSNRVVMAPMTRCRATSDHVPTDIMVKYYADRAQAGLLITEGVAPSPNGAGYARTPGLWNAEQVKAWKPVTAAVHQAGGQIVAQIMHTGRVSHVLNMPEGAEVLSASATQCPGEMYTDAEGMKAYPIARAMTEAEIEAAIAEIVTAAENAMAAGFDGVELHGANGYLINQFFEPSTNQRTDAWGGDVEGRGRFVLEVARRTADAIGCGRVGIRLSPFGAASGMVAWETTSDDYVWLAGKLGELTLAYLHVVDHSAMGAPPVPTATKEAMRDAFGGAVILAGGYDRDSANADLSLGLAHFIGFGRPFIANPDLMQRLRDGVTLNAPDFGTFYTPGEKGYNDYPTLG